MLLLSVVFVRQIHFLQVIVTLMLIPSAIRSSPEVVSQIASYEPQVVANEHQNVTNEEKVAANTPPFLINEYQTTTNEPQVVINEIQASNNTTITDEDGHYEDWIELYNPGSTGTADLSHYGLSDDPERPFRWVIPEGVTLSPGEFLLIRASGKDRRDPAGPLHTNFAIAREGEEVLLTHPTLPEDRHLIDHVPPVHIPSDRSYGRLPDGSDDWVFFDRPTPGTTNSSSTGFGKILDPPEFSADDGFHTGPLTLEITTRHEGAQIRYTLDGSEPGPDAPLYHGPISITDRSEEPNDLSEITEISHQYAPAGTPDSKVYKGTVVRARVFRDGDLPGPARTGTWFIYEEGNNRYSLPVITITTDRDHLFDFDEGIYVLGRVHQEWRDKGGTTFNGGTPANYNRQGRDWERPAHLAFYETDGSKTIDQDIGIRIHGGWGRAFPQKSFRLYSRSDYGESRFRYQMFPHLELDDFNRLILRNSGQDVTSTMFRDVYIQESVRHMRFDVQHARPAIVFLNGEYWGIYNVRQRYDRHYLETHYGLGPGEIDLLTRSANNPKEGDNTDYLELRDGLLGADTTDMNHPANFEKARHQIDIDNLIDYFIAQIHSANTDWPHNNIDFWRAAHGEYHPEADVPEQDGRWRWLMYDTDFGFGWFSRVTENTLDRATGSGRYAWSNTLFDGLMSGQPFRDRFYNRYADQLNTAFQPGHMSALLDSLQAIYAPEIDEHIHRRGDAEFRLSGSNRYPMSYNEWVDDVEEMRQFAVKRPGHQWDHLMQFGSRDTLALTLDVADPAQGYIRVNTVDIRPGAVGVDKDPWPWQGFYFRDLPVTVTAWARPGYEFDSWEKQKLSPQRTENFSDTRDSSNTGNSSETRNSSGTENLPDTKDSSQTEYLSEIKVELPMTERVRLTALFRKATDADSTPEPVPASFSLDQNYPNPFNTGTRITFELPEESPVQLDVFDALGRKVSVLVDDVLTEGRHTVMFDGSGLASGVYIYRLQAGSFRRSRTMLLLK